MFSKVSKQGGTHRCSSHRLLQIKYGHVLSCLEESSRDQSGNVKYGDVELSTDAEWHTLRFESLAATIVKMWSSYDQLRMVK